MYHVPESECFTAKYRAVLRGEEIKLFTPNDSIPLYSQVNFDNQSLQKSAVDYFAVSILGGILSSVKAHFVQQRADIVISSDLTDETFTQLTQNALRCCFIYNTITKAFPLNIEFEQVL